MEAVCLVVEPVAVIAEDLAASVVEGWPGCRVIVAPDAATALSAVASLPVIQAAFVHAAPDGFSGRPLGRALAERRATVIFMGLRAESSPGPHMVLQSPFAPADVLQALVQLETQRGTKGAVPTTAPRRHPA
jgi:hypothetical protein